MPHRLREIRRAAKLLRESNGELRENLSQAGEFFWSALFDADTWPPELQQKADRIVEKILAGGTIEQTVRNMDRESAREVVNLILDFARSMEDFAREEGEEMPESN